MSKFYTYAQAWGNTILYRGYEDGEAKQDKINFEPTLFLNSATPTGWKSLYSSSHVAPKQFSSIKAAKKFIEQYEDVAGMEVHGMQKFQYQYINENFTDDVVYDMSLIKMLIFDLEVIAENGFPDIQLAKDPITLISMYNSHNKKTVVLGLKDYTCSSDDEFEYRKFQSESEMLKYFIAYNAVNGIDVWSGWNTDNFDIVYLVNRMMRLLGEEVTKRLSPFGIIREKMIEIRGREIQTYEVFGIISLDYLELYKKFGTYSAKASYALGFIAQEELGKTKLELPGKTFKDNYDNYFATFVKYNAIDVLLVKELDDKLHLFDLAFSLAYLYKCNLQDVYKTVVPWECLIHNYLWKKNIVVPAHSDKMDAPFDGAWVKEPKPKMYGWVMSYDLNSLYPSIIQQWNISPETFVGMDVDGVTKAYNGASFEKGRIGFLPEILISIMAGRSAAKKKMLAAKSEYQKTHDASLDQLVSMYDALQKALKVVNNSCYGALGQKGFLYYDYRLAEAVTLTGQHVIKKVSADVTAKLNSVLGTSNVEYDIYQDTDSLYIDCDSIVQKYAQGKSTDEIVKFLDAFGNKIIQPQIDLSLKEISIESNCNEATLGMKREAIASKMLMRGKKNYAMYVHDSEGVAYNPPDIKIMGIEVVRSSTPKWCQEKLRESIRLMFEKDEIFLRDYYRNLLSEFKTLSVEDISCPRSVSDIDKWASSNSIYKKNTPMHCRASLLYNWKAEACEVDKIQNGDKIKYVYLKLPNPINENVIAFPSADKLPVAMGLNKYVDYDLQFEKTFKAPLTSITDAIGWTLEETSSLKAFFV